MLRQVAKRLSRRGPGITHAQVKDYWSSSDSEKVCRSLGLVDGPQVRADGHFVREFLGPLFAGKKVLDLGAGPGRFVPIWREFGVDLACLDWSDTFFEHLSARCAEAGARAFNLDITASKLDETFDLIFSTQLLLHIQPEHLDAALANIRSMMRGKVCVFTSAHAHGAGADRTTGEKISGYSHDYAVRFAKAGLRIDWQADVMIFKHAATFDRPPKFVPNKLYYLSAA